MTLSADSHRASCQPDRRQVLSWAAGSSGLLAVLAWLPGCASAAAPRYRVGLPEMQQALTGRFPRRYPLAGLLELQLFTPTLGLRPERDQLNALADLQASGPLLPGRPAQGVLDVDFGLRYEPSDRTIRTDRLQVNAFRVQGLPPTLSQLLARYGVSLATQALNDVVLHQLREADLALVEGLGLQPERIRVTKSGLAVDFAPRRPS